MIGEMPDKGALNRSSRRDETSVKDLGGDVGRMVLAYAKQETVDPLKALGRYVLWGVLGAILISLGVVLVALAAVRAVESELVPHLAGKLTWVPYLAGVVFAAVVAGLAVSRIGKSPR